MVSDAGSSDSSRGDARTFAGLRVAAFESRRADDMQRLIQRAGGVPFVAPSMREVSVGGNPEAVDFAHRLLAGEVDVVLFMTGVGIRFLVAQIERHVDRQRFLNSLSDITTIVRGPKPFNVLKELGITPTHRIPEPNTWREILATIDQQIPIGDMNVVLQEYGRPNPSLVAGLEARGARVRSVKVYEWDFPEDTTALEATVRQIAAGEIDVALFTSAHQLVNLFRMADQLELTDAVTRQMDRLVVASIGATTSEALRDRELWVDIEPEHSKMGHLVQAAAEQAGRVLQKKRQAGGIHLNADQKIRAAAAVESRPVPTGPWDDSPFMKACRLEPCDRVPVWLMRQAGRYMAEYREVRAKTTFLELCKNPSLCAEVMITAVNRLGVDAAIIFSDLLPMLEPMGVQLEFAKGEGPVIHNPVRTAADVDRIHELHSLETLEFVMETVRQTRADLSPRIPLIGFAGAPFTLASYVIEGAGSRTYTHAKRLMYADEGAWNELLGRIARSVTRYLNAQIDAGAQAVQLFDSWVGCLGPEEYRRYVLPHVKTIVQGLRPGVPLINFATGNPALLPLLSEAGGAVIGIDWRIRLDDAWRVVGHDKAVQGNMDPHVLLSTPAQIRLRAAEILQQAEGRPGHIFNLGHGVLQETPVENVIALVDAVHELGSK